MSVPSPSKLSLGLDLREPLHDGDLRTRLLRSVEYRGHFLVVDGDVGGFQDGEEELAIHVCLRWSATEG